MKLVVAETGSDLAVALWETSYPAASSILSYPEGRASLAAARRGGRLSSNQHRRALEDFEATHGQLLLVGIDEALTRHAGELAENLGLRGYDAVHLASALALGEETTLVTWDKELGQAALESGCAIAPA